MTEEGQKVISDSFLKTQSTFCLMLRHHQKNKYFSSIVRSNKKSSMMFIHITKEKVPKIQESPRITN